MTDRDLKQHVHNALDREPSVDARNIGVSVDEGVVTLRGNVGSFAGKISAERAALRVFGVKAVANDLNVHPASGDERTDTAIAQAAVAALRWNAVVPPDRITVTVTNGWLTLSGVLEYYYQSAAAERAVRDLIGVKGVSNMILLGVPVTPVRSGDVTAQIEAAFRRSATMSLIE